MQLERHIHFMRGEREREREKGGGRRIKEQRNRKLQRDEKRHVMLTTHSSLLWCMSFWQLATVTLGYSWCELSPVQIRISGCSKCKWTFTPLTGQDLALWPVSSSCDVYSSKNDDWPLNVSSLISRCIKVKVVYTLRSGFTLHFERLAV